MRDILFRGKCVDNGEWVEGFYTQKMNPYTPNGLPIKHFILDLAPFGVDVLPETIGQYTGLTDKNGVKIFEGDIIRFKDNIGYVIYTDDDASFLVDSPNRYIAMDYSNEFEIIGNIHDNPELMKGGADNDR